jgi:hypothetical protein
MMNFIFRTATLSVCAHFTRLPQWPQTRSWTAACLSVLIPVTAWAQTADRDPLNTQTAVPLPVYQSAFSDYKPYQDPELIPWKTANEVVREFGGMAGMGDMSDGKNPDNADAQTGGSEEAKSPAQPPHDMSNMKSDTRASKKPAPASKPAEMQSMPGHDMSKMQKAPAVPATKPSPPMGKPAIPAPMTMPGMSH